MLPQRQNSFNPKKNEMGSCTENSVVLDTENGICLWNNQIFKTASLRCDNIYYCWAKFSRQICPKIPWKKYRNNDKNIQNYSASKQKSKQPHFKDAFIILKSNAVQNWSSRCHLVIVDILFCLIAKLHCRTSMKKQVFINKHSQITGRVKTPAKGYGMGKTQE